MRAHELLPQAPLMRLIDKNDQASLESAIDSSIAQIICPYFESLDVEIISKIHQQGKEAYFYYYHSDETEDTQKKMIALDIDGLFTDYTDKTISLIEQADKVYK